MAVEYTLNSDNFVPEVVGDLIATDYNKYITVSNFIDVDTTLVGQPGDTLTLDQYNYIGDAEVLAESAIGSASKLTSGKITKTVVKVAKGVVLTDEVVNSVFGDPYGEAVKQIAQSIAFKDDADVITELATATQTATGTSLAKSIVAGLKVYGERALRNDVITFCNTSDYYDMIADYQNWIPASEISADLVQKGAVGRYFGATVVPTDTVTAKSPYLYITHSAKKVMKANFLAERERELTNFTWLLAGSEHRAQFLVVPKGVVKLTVSST